MKRFMVDRFGHSLQDTRSMREEVNEENRRQSLTNVSREYLEQFYVTKTDDEKKHSETRDYVDKRFVTKVVYEQNLQNIKNDERRVSMEIKNIFARIQKRS